MQNASERTLIWFRNGLEFCFPDAVQYLTPVNEQLFIKISFKNLQNKEQKDTFRLNVTQKLGTWVDKNKIIKKKS